MNDTPIRPQPQPGIDKIAPYVPGRSDVPAGVKLVKLSANESPLGASPKAVEASRAMADKIHVYPEGSSRELRQALGEVNGIDPDRIVCGFGSDDLLHLLAQVYLGEGDQAVMSQYGFNVYPIITRGASAEIIMAPETDYCADVDALLAAVTPRTKVVFLANPNNPTGTYLSDAEVRRLHAGLRPDILFVLDNAYAEYVTADDFTVGIDLVDAAENVVMVRTFSKMGIAGERVGWMYGPAHIVDAVHRIRGPFNVSLSGQAAAAAAARAVAALPPPAARLRLVRLRACPVRPSPRVRPLAPSPTSSARAIRRPARATCSARARSRASYSARSSAVMWRSASFSSQSRGRSMASST